MTNSITQVNIDLLMPVFKTKTHEIELSKMLAEEYIHLVTRGTQEIRSSTRWQVYLKSIITGNKSESDYSYHFIARFADSGMFNGFILAASPALFMPAHTCLMEDVTDFLSIV